MKKYPVKIQSRKSARSRKDDSGKTRPVAKSKPARRVLFLDPSGNPCPARRGAGVSVSTPAGVSLPTLGDSSTRRAFVLLGLAQHLGRQF